MKKNRNNQSQSSEAKETSDLDSQASSYAESMESFSAHGTSAMRKITSEAKSAGTALFGLVGRLNWLQAAADGVMKLAELSYDSALAHEEITHLANRYNLNESSKEELRSKIDETVVERRVEKTDLIQATNANMETTGDATGAINNLTNIADLITIFKDLGISAEAAGRYIGNLQRQGYTAEQIRQNMANTVEASTVGSGNLAEQSVEINRVNSKGYWAAPESSSQMLLITRLANNKFASSRQATDAIDEIAEKTHDPEFQQGLKKEFNFDLHDTNGKEKTPLEVFTFLQQAAKKPDNSLSDSLSADALKLIGSVSAPENYLTIKEKSQDQSDKQLTERIYRQTHTVSGANLDMENRARYVRDNTFGNSMGIIADVGDEVVQNFVQTPTEQATEQAAERERIRHQSATFSSPNPFMDGHYATNEEYSARIDPSRRIKQPAQPLANSTQETNLLLSSTQRFENKEKISNVSTTLGNIALETLMLSGSSKPLIAPLTQPIPVKLVEPTEAKPELPPPTGQVTIRVVTEPGTTATTTSVVSRNLDLNVDTGRTYGVPSL